ncbi:MAG: alanine racemase [Desulfobacterales bacterium]
MMGLTFSVSLIVKVLICVGILSLLVRIFRPRDRGEPYDDYFSALNEELKRHGPGYPALVLDLDRLDQNIQTMKEHIGDVRRYRVVAKSLPSVKLIRRVFEQTGTSRLMVFHLPFINLLAEEFPGAQMLLGKPMPINAVRVFYQNLKPNNDFHPQKQLQWLIDSRDRLEQYLKFAEQNSTRLLINIEIDVGLHRGGIKNIHELNELLLIIQEKPQHLTFTGFMGYDAHIAKAPLLISSQQSAFKKVLDIYRNFIHYGRKYYPEMFSRELTFNGAGSLTYPLYRSIMDINDISAGSGLVKPEDFDRDTLKDHVPALFVAAPVLKQSRGLRIPYIEFLSPVLGWLNPNWKNTFFIYGGYWKANYHQPKGLYKNRIYGYSSNQEIATASDRTGLTVDDHLFLRPTQSEAVMLQFGELIVIEDGKIIDRWPVFNPQHQAASNALR